MRIRRGRAAVAAIRVAFCGVGRVMGETRMGGCLSLAPGETRCKGLYPPSRSIALQGTKEREEVLLTSPPPRAAGMTLRPDVTAWMVLHTKARQEKAVARFLAAAGLTYYLPLIDRVTLVRGRKQRSHVPLLPGYVF